MFICLFASEVNGLLLKTTHLNITYFTTNITPITEELLKAIPIIYYAAVFSEDRKSIVTVAFSIGVGFAMIENMIILTQHFSSVNLFFACIRGFSSGLMHSICAVMSGYFASFIHKKKKIFRSGTICAFNLAIVYHSVFNLLVEANSQPAKYIGYFLPIVTYAIINAFFNPKNQKS